MILRLIDPEARKDFGSRRDSDWAVQGIALANVICQFSGGREPSPRLKQVGLAMLTEQISNTTIRTALRPLSTMRTEDARRVFQAIASCIPQIAPESALGRALEVAMHRTEARSAAEQSLAHVKTKPETFIKALAEFDKPRYEANMQIPSAWGDAVLIAANEREGQTLYEEICRRAGVSMLTPQRLAGSTIGFQGTIFHEQGGRRTVIVVTIPDTGPKAAAAVVDDILEWGVPRLLLFVGCAGEITAKHRTPPSKPLVVVARQIVDRDPSVIKAGGTDYGMRGYPSSEELLNWVRALAVERAFGDLDVRVDRL